jgi:hypothetical protein
VAEAFANAGAVAYILETIKNEKDARGMSFFLFFKAADSLFLAFPFSSGLFWLFQ